MQPIPRMVAETALSSPMSWATSSLYASAQYKSPLSTLLTSTALAPDPVLTSLPARLDVVSQQQATPSDFQEILATALTLPLTM